MTPPESFDLPLSVVAQRYRVDRRTVFRWLVNGVTDSSGRLVRLDGLRIGGVYRTSWEAVRQFVDALNGKSEPRRVRTPEQHAKAADAAMKQLAAMGIDMD